MPVVEVCHWRGARPYLMSYDRVISDMAGVWIKTIPGICCMASTGGVCLMLFGAPCFAMLGHRPAIGNTTSVMLWQRSPCTPRQQFVQDMAGQSENQYFLWCCTLHTQLIDGHNIIGRGWCPKCNREQVPHFASQACPDG